MAIPVIFAGTTYQIPETGETGWGDEVTNYLVALSQAVLLNDFKIKTRRVTTSPVAVAANDVHIICANPAIPFAVNIPSSAINKVYVVSDGGGNARVNNITITATANISGSTTYVIEENYGFVILVYDGVQWNVVAEGKTPIRGPVRFFNTAPNTSFIESAVINANSINTCTNGQSCSASFIGSDAIVFSVSYSGGSIICSTDFTSPRISCISDMNNLFLTQDAGVGIYVSKLASSSVINVKNRLGITTAIEIKALTNTLNNITAWS